MTKFIVSQDRGKIVEVQNCIRIEPNSTNPNLFKIKCNDFVLAKDFTEEEAKQQLLLIADFLNRKNTVNDAVYFMPVQKTKNKKYRLTVYSHYEEDEAEPYTVDYDSMPDALNAKEQYENEVTLSGQQAYSVIGPDLIEV